MIVGVAAALPAVLVVSSSFIGRDVFRGLISGLILAVGLAIVYRAMADSSSAIAAPTAAVLAALVPLVWDLIGGTRLSGLETLGCLIALASLVLTTVNPALGDRVRAGLSLSLVGGVLFGISIVVAADTSEASGAWPAVSQRAGGFMLMAVLAKMRRVPVLLPAGVRRFGVAGGIAGALGMVCWIVGSQIGDVGTVSVVGSTYPAVVVVLASRFDDDQVRWWQGLGIAGAIAGSALIALG